jgi:DNA-binding transcriptional ArsR family regulator
MSDILRALSAPRRREILRLIWAEERSVAEICRAHPEITIGAISQHLRILESARLVTKRKDGLHHFYRARPKELGSLRLWLEGMWDSALYRLKIKAELEQARRGPHPSKNRRKRR